MSSEPDNNETEHLAFVSGHELEEDGQNPLYHDEESHSSSLGRMNNEETTWKNFLCKSTHPMAATFHVLFKGAALLIYILSGFFINNFVLTFVVCVLLLACDFWTVKNITGRLLVGLRWWNKINDDGTNKWVYESHPDAQRQVPAIDRRIFWWSMYIAVLGWSTLALLALIRLSFDWFIICAVALALTASNLLGYIRCNKEARKRMRAALSGNTSSLIPSIAAQIGGNMFGFLSGFNDDSTESQGAAAPRRSNSAPSSAVSSNSQNAFRGDISGTSNA